MEKITIGLISNDKIGKQMAGPGVRYWELAKCLSSRGNLKVVLFTPGPCDLSAAGVKIISYRTKKQSSVLKHLSGIDVVIVQSLTPWVLRGVRARGIKYIADLYDPVPVEILEYFRFASPATQKYSFRYAVVELLNQLYYADHILYATEAQKDLYLGLMMSYGIIRPAEYYKDQNLSRFMTLAPFGISRSPLKATDAAVPARQFPSLRPTDKLVYWGGGIWNWFDPLTVIKAIEKLSRKRSDIKLLFLGTRHPNPNIAMETMCLKAVDYAKKHNLIDRFVYFNFGWVPYEQRVNYLSRANIGVSAHFDNLETRYSFRTRVLDYLWAGIPIITTQGDAMAKLVSRHKLGEVVGYEDVSGMAKVIERLADNKALSSQIKANISRVKPKFYWDKICGDIANIIENKLFQKRPLSWATRWRLLFLFYWTGFLKRYFK